MGSVQSDENCPKCKSKDDMVVDCHYRRGITFGFCQTCGYTWEETPNGFKSWGGHGSYYAVTRRGGGSMGSFKTVRSIPKTIAALKRKADSVNCHHIQVVIRKNGRILKSTIQGGGRKFGKFQFNHRRLNDVLNGRETGDLPF